MPNLTITERSWVQIDLGAFRHNLDYLKGYLNPNQQFMMIVKADGYGHGAFEISRAALEAGAVYLGVANPEEGKLLRIQGCKAPILILSPSLEQEIDTIIAYNLCPSVSNLPFALTLDGAAKRKAQQISIHLKIDTGMHRSGENCEGFLRLYNSICKLENLSIEGVFSHFAASETDQEFSRFQEHRFNTAIEALPVKPRYIHMDNSNALVNGLGEAGNLVRLGILAYGVNTSIHPLPLKPVMTFKATLSQIKTIRKGETIGYNRTWIAPQDGRYGIIPIGYADGYDFLLSNLGVVLYKKKLLNALGRISMDMITIDLNPVPNAKVGDIITLLGHGNLAIHAENVTQLYSGSPYELLCQIGRRAKRYYFQGSKLLHSTPLSRRDFVPDDYGDSKLNQIIESAIAQRLQSAEIGELIYREILRTFFYNRDRDIHYRNNFHHEVVFSESLHVGYYRVSTSLLFDKVLQHDYFVVACASSDEILQRYFKRNDVEYRWLMDDAFELDEDSFVVSSVMVNELVLFTEVKHKNGCLEITCSHPQLTKLIGTKVNFRINTLTLYPKTSHQFSVFINELTRGVDVSFSYPGEIGSMECIPVFSGQNKFPRITREEGKIRVFSSQDEWVFPISGIVFAY